MLTTLLCAAHFCGLRACERDSGGRVAQQLLHHFHVFTIRLELRSFSRERDVYHNHHETNELQTAGFCETSFQGNRDSGALHIAGCGMRGPADGSRPRSRGEEPKEVPPEL